MTELLDFGNYPEFSGDGLGDVQFIGKNVQIYVFGWRRIDKVWRRVVTGFATVPQDALPAENIDRLRKEYSPEENRAH